MARKPDERRYRAKDMFLFSDGQKPLKTIAEELHVNYATVRRWKGEDKWQEALDKPKRGGQKGNRNAKGHGAPEGNRNAETSGAYVASYLLRLSEEEKKQISELDGIDVPSALLDEYKRLKAKQLYLEKKIEELENAGEKMYINSENITSIKQDDGAFRQTAKFTAKSSAFLRQRTLEAELARASGRLLRVIEAIRSCGIDASKAENETERLRLYRQKLTGEIDLPDENGEPDESCDEKDDSIDGNDVP